MKTKIVTMFSALLFVLFTGCSSNVLLKGTVTFSDDGSPLECGIVIFDNGKHNARAYIQPDGTFTVGLFKAGDGLPPGDYKVCIAGAARLLPSPENEDDDPDNNVRPRMQQLIARRYESFETSGLSLTVDASTKQHNITVDRYQGRGRNRADAWNR